MTRTPLRWLDEGAVSDIRNRIKEVKRIRFSEVANHPRNPKRHPEAQRKAFRGSLQELGFVSVPLAYHSERTGQLTWVDGHLRGSEVNGYTGDVAILDIDDAEADKLLLYADPIAAMAEYESQQLDGLLRDISTTDHALTAMLAGMAADNGLYPDKKPVADPGAQIDKADELRQKWGVQSGNLYILGQHRLICGDCTDKATVERLMQGERAQFEFSDPPYQLDTVGGGVLKDAAQMRAIEKAEIDKFDPLHLRMIAPTALFCCNKPLVKSYIELAENLKVAWDICFYKKENTPPNYGGHMMTDTEYLMLLGKQSPNSGLEKQLYSKAYIGKADDDAAVAWAKPVGLVEKYVMLYSTLGGVVVDRYVGSGTTLIACERLGRQCRAVEISPAYCAVALERWSLATNTQPVRVEA